VRALLLALVLYAVPALASAQQSEIRLVPGPGVRALWEQVVACAGEMRDTTKTFEEINWYLRDSTFYQGDLLLGEWVPPDTIYLLPGEHLKGWVVAHEMLHHAINGLREAGGNPHPLNPFMFPCQLMAFQQAAGGMNGGTPLKTAYAEGSWK
jgi:hypothetical protein